MASNKKKKDGYKLKSSRADHSRRSKKGWITRRQRGWVSKQKDVSTQAKSKSRTKLYDPISVKRKTIKHQQKEFKFNPEQEAKFTGQELSPDIKEALSKSFAKQREYDKTYNEAYSQYKKDVDKFLKIPKSTRDKEGLQRPKPPKRNLEDTTLINTVQDLEKEGKVISREEWIEISPTSVTSSKDKKGIEKEFERIKDLKKKGVYRETYKDVGGQKIPVHEVKAKKFYDPKTGTALTTGLYGGHGRILSGDVKDEIKQLELGQTSAQKVFVSHTDPDLIGEEDVALIQAPIEVSPGDIYEHFGHQRAKGIEGMIRQHEFNKEMKRRKWRGLKEGTDYRGRSIDWNRNKLGGSVANESKADVFITSPKEHHFLLNKFTPIADVGEEGIPEVEFTVSRQPWTQRTPVVGTGGGIVSGTTQTEKSTGEGYIIEAEDNFQKALEAADIGSVSEGNITTTWVDERGRRITDPSKYNKPHIYHKVRIRSKSLNPDTQVKLAKALEAYNYGLMEHDTEGNPIVKLKGVPQRRERVRVPYSSTQPEYPTDFEKQVVGHEVRERFRDRLGFTPGRLSPSGVDLSTKEVKDLHTYKLPEKGPFKSRVVGARLGASTERIGTLPGEKEVRDITTGIQREAYRAKLERALIADDPAKLETFISKEHPEFAGDEVQAIAADLKNVASLEEMTDGQRKFYLKDHYKMSDEEASKFSDEVKMVGGAAAAASFLTARRKGARGITVGAASSALSKLPEKQRNIIINKHLLPGSIEEEVFLNLQKVTQEKVGKSWMGLKHPFSDLDTGISGMKFEKRGAKGVLRGRSFAVNEGFKQARILEDARLELELQARTLERAQKAVFMDNPPPTSLASKFSRRRDLYKAERVLGESYHKTLADRAANLKHEARGARRKLYSKGSIADNPSWRSPDIAKAGVIEAEKSIQAADAIQQKLKEGGALGYKAPPTSQIHGQISLNQLRAEARILPKVVTKRNVAIGGGAMLATGASLYAYDRYRTHKLEKAKELGRDLKYKPEKAITYSTFKVKHKDVVIPPSALTVGFGIAGEKVPSPDPRDWSIKKTKKRKVYANKKDITGEGNLKGLPTGLTGVRVGGDRGGSWKESMTWELDPGKQDRANVFEGYSKVSIGEKGPTLPGRFKIGPKETDQRKLSTRNPRKLLKEDKEKIAVIASNDPHTAGFYSSDPDIADMITNEAVLGELRDKHREMFAPRGTRYRPKDVTVEKVSGVTGEHQVFGLSGSKSDQIYKDTIQDKTYEDWKAEERREERERRRYLTELGRIP